MKLRNILIVVKDIARARKYYHDLFGLDMLLDNDEKLVIPNTSMSVYDGCVVCWRGEKIIAKVLRRPISVFISGIIISNKTI